MPKLLLVDDEINLLYSFKLLLSKQGYEISTAQDMETAIEALNSEDFDIIIADIVLKGQNGVQILDEVNRREVHVPVIMITGQPSVENARDSLRLGAFDYLVKPVDRDTLYRITDRALEHKRLLDHKLYLERENERIRNRLEAIFQSVQEAIICVDPQMKIVQGNHAAERLCGYHPEKHRGKSFHEVFDCGSNSCCKYLQQVLNYNTTVNNIRIECPRSSKQVTVLTSSPLIDSNGNFSGAVLVNRDISRIEQMEKNLANRRKFPNIIGDSRPMQAIYNYIEDLVDTDTTVLISGETGTGKELVAEALHFNGKRASGPLIKINCSALSENILESELFGHVRGAFTGAIKDKPGRFQMANGGTILLDEIGDISSRIQLKLLRVLQEKIVERVGDTKAETVDVRVIAATNCNLRRKVEQGEFRDDLYYRLKVVEIPIPPLRERKEDIPLLVEHFRILFKKSLKKEIREISEEAKQVLQRYDWPGNIRELRHAIEHACVRCHTGVIEAEHLPSELRQVKSQEEVTKNKNLDSENLINALQKAGGNKSKAADYLGISRPTLYRKIKEHGISAKDL